MIRDLLFSTASVTGLATGTEMAVTIPPMLVTARMNAVYHQIICHRHHCRQRHHRHLTIFIVKYTNPLFGHLSPPCTIFAGM